MGMSRRDHSRDRYYECNTGVRGKRLGMAPPAGAPSAGSSSRRRRLSVLLVLCWSALLGPIMWQKMLVGWPEGERAPGRRLSRSGVTLGGAALAAGSGATQASRPLRPVHRTVLEGSTADHEILEGRSGRAAAAGGRAGWLGRADGPAMEAVPAAGGSGRTPTGVPAIQESSPGGRADIFLFIGILSGAGQELRRAAVREAWSRAAQQPGHVRGPCAVPRPALQQRHACSALTARGAACGCTGRQGCCLWLHWPPGVLNARGSAAGVCSIAHPAVVRRPKGTVAIRWPALFVPRTAVALSSIGLPLSVRARRSRRALCCPSGSARRRWMRSRPSMATSSLCPSAPTTRPSG